MKVRLAYKLFGAFLLILGVVICAVVVARQMTERNFRDYIHRMESEKLQRLAPVLVDLYKTHGSWKGLPDDPGGWHRIFQEVKGDDAEGPAPPIHGSLPKEGPRGLLLLDENRRPLVGHPAPEDTPSLIAVEVDGRVVGWLGRHHREPFKSGPPAELLKRQARQFYLLAAVVIAVTALLAIIFSRHLLAPVQRLAKGTRELAQRNFAVRIPTGSGDELGQLADNFNAMARTLEAYETTRRQWLTDISHELRTPLAVLRGEIEAIQDGVRQPTADNLDSLHAEILRVAKLVDDLHLLALAESDNLLLDRQQVFPARVLEAVLDSYRPCFERRQIQVTEAIEPIDGVAMDGDAGRLEQVFTNIFENACKYAQSPGNLTVSGKAAAKQLTITVADTGPGVPEETLPRLFDRLFRVDTSRNRDSGGSGLGLAICQQIVNHHGGRIWAENNAMGGLTIAVVLPCTRRGAARGK